MREIVDQVLAELEADREFALVTLVGERGSTPRALGAQMLVRRDGSIAGTIGGGLLEATMMDEAAAAIREGRSRLGSLELAGRSVTDQEMLCGGSAEVLIAVVPPGDATLRATCAGVAEAAAAGRRAWFFMFFAEPQPARGVGIGAEGAGGPTLEVATEVGYCLLDDEGETVGDAPCDPRELRRLVGKIGVHGTAALPDGRRVFTETIDLPSRAVICGAGHVAQALAPITESVGFATVVLDDRAEFANVGRFPHASRVDVLEDFDAAFAQVGVDEHTYIVIVTRGHQYDFSVLAQALRTPAAYIGLMSSRTKRGRIEAGLRDSGFTEAAIARVRMPVGLAIGAETPAELAISIVAEMIQVRAESA